MAKKHERLGAILVSWGVLEKKDLRKALEQSKTNPYRIGEVLVEMGVLALLVFLYPCVRVFSVSGSAVF